MRHWIRKIVPVFAGAICFGCSTTTTAPGGSGSGQSSTDVSLDRRPLVGVWEVTKYLQTYGSPPRSFAANVKYCFTESQAYLEIAPDSATDTRDGWWPYEVEGDMLVLKQPVGESIMHFRMLSPTEMTLTQNGLQMTLRKISPTVNAGNLSTPVLPRKLLPIESPARVAPPTASTAPRVEPNR